MDKQNNITIDRLRYFSEAARQEHVGRASKILHVSPSVISSAIRQLELEMDLKLFVRERQKIRLNNDGKRMLEQAEDILSSVENLKKGLRPEPASLKGHYRIGASHFLMDKYLIPSILKLQSKVPQITFELSSMDTAIAMAQLKAGMLDAALVFRSSYSEIMEEQIIGKGNFQITVRNNHPILKMPIKKRIGALNLLPAISFRTSIGANFWERHPALLTAGVIPKHAYFYDDTQTALSILNNTDCWAFLPDHIIKHNSKIKPVRLPENIEAPVNVSLVSTENIRTKLFLEKLKPLLLGNRFE